MIAAIAWALVSAVGGIVLGWFAVPWASDVALRRAGDRADAWWCDSLQGYQAFKRERPGAEPSASAPGFEGALGLWRDDACSAALSGRLTVERLNSLAGVGIKVEGLAASGTESERRVRCSYQPKRWHRALCALLLGAAFLASAAFVLHKGAAMALDACAVGMAVAVVCDLRARTIPLETCVLVTLAGAVFQLAVQGPTGTAMGIAFALALMVGGAAINRVLRVRCPGGAVGRGDVRCMGALAVATGAGAACGFAVCYALAGLAALTGCVTRRLTWSDGIPMAPFLSAWLVCGAAVSLAFA